MREEPRPLGLAGGGVMIDEIAAAPAEHLANRRRREIGRLRRDVVRAEQVEDFLAVAKDAAIERIDEERQLVREAAHDEVSGQAHGLELDAEALRHEQINDA